MSTVEPDPSLEPVVAEPPGPSTALIDRKLPLWRLVLLLALPWWTQQILTMIVTLFDAFLAGNVLDLPGEQNVVSQSAQTTAHYLSWVMSSYAVLISAGSTALVARFTGAKDRRMAIHATNQSLVLAFGFGLAGTVLGLLYIQEFMHLMQLEGTAGTMAADYLRPMLIALTFQMIQAVGIACLIGAGDTVTGMWIMSGVAIINVPLAWGFCQGWGPLPELGFVGIATGTACSHVLGCLAVLVVLGRGRAGLQLHFAQLRPDFDLIRRLLRISVPAGIDSLSVVAGQLWFLRIINDLGNVASAAHGIAIRWEALGYMSGNAFGVAAMALVGQYLGARRPDQAARGGWSAFALGCGIMCVMGAVFFSLAEPMFALFCPRPEQRPIIDEGVPVLRLVAFAMPAVASCIVFTYALRGAGDTRMPVLITWIGFLGIRIPLAYWLTGQDFLGVHLPLASWLTGRSSLELMGAWWAMFADLFFRGIALFIRFSTGRWKGIRV